MVSRPFAALVLLSMACAPARVVEPAPRRAAPSLGAAAPAPQVRSGPYQDRDAAAAVRAHARDGAGPLALRRVGRGLEPVPECVLLDRLGATEVFERPREQTSPGLVEHGSPPPSTFHVLDDPDLSAGAFFRMERTRWSLDGPVTRRGDCEGVTHATSAIDRGIRLGTCEEARGLADPADAFVLECPRDVLAFEARPIVLAPPGAESEPLIEPMVRIPGGTVNGRTIASFWIDRDEVGHEAVTRCVRAGVCGTGREPPRPGHAANPPAEVSLARASLYCAWVGKRLPTLAEWTWAAQGREEQRTYPWGEAPPDYARVSAVDAAHERSVLAADVDSDDPRILRIRSEGRWYGLWRTEPDARGVRPLGTSRDGVRDLIGNMREAVRDVRPNGSVHRFAVGASFRSRLPDHSDIVLTNDADADQALRTFREHELEALTVAGAPLRLREVGAGGLSSQGARCAADDPPAGAAIGPRVVTIGDLEFYAPLGLRRFAEASALCSAGPGEDGRWSVASADQLAAAYAVDDPKPRWTDDGRIWWARGGASNADPDATAFVSCVAE